MTHLEDDVALKLIHTADWHLGHRFPSFDEHQRPELTRARLNVLDAILGVAERYQVDAILCAGDLFDGPDPGETWWRPVATKLTEMRQPRPVFLLPGNHDPLQAGSVYHPDHAFRHALPVWAHVVDRDDFCYELNHQAMLYARPCRSRAGQDDPAMALPARAPGDHRIRIGMAHGSTFDMPDCAIHFPIARDAAKLRGFDYLAIGDTHSFRNVSPEHEPPVVYPGAPEPTSFDEPGAGHVARVFVSHSRKVKLAREPVAYWRWSERVIDSLGALRTLAHEPDLPRTVLRLVLKLRVTAPEHEECEQILRALAGSAAVQGRAGVLKVDARELVLDTHDIEAQLGNLPSVLRSTVAALKAKETGDQAEIARLALHHLYKLARQAGAS